MREIKFRAWDKKKKEMLKHESTLALSRGPHLIIAIYQKSSTQEEKTYVENPELVLMQYTGLNDAKGVEIYEGDLLKRKSSGTIMEVHWISKRGTWAVTNRVSPHKYKVADYCHGAEIIGNVWENGDLLTNKI